MSFYGPACASELSKTWFVLRGPLFLRKTQEGCNCRFQTTACAEGGDKVQGSVEPRFPAGLPFLVPEIEECIAFCNSGNFSSNFPRTSPEFSLGTPEKNPETATALVTRIVATSKSQIASDCNRNSKESLRLRKHPLKPTLWT